MLTPNASRLLHHWTPRNQAQLNAARRRPRLDSSGGRCLHDRHLAGPVREGTGSSACCLAARARRHARADGRPSCRARFRAPRRLRGVLCDGGVAGAVAPCGCSSATTPASRSLRAFFDRAGGFRSRGGAARQGRAPSSRAGAAHHAYDHARRLRCVFNQATSAVVGHLPARRRALWESCQIVTDGHIALPQGDANSARHGRGSSTSTASRFGGATCGPCWPKRRVRKGLQRLVQRAQLVRDVWMKPSVWSSRRFRLCSSSRRASSRSSIASAAGRRSSSARARLDCTETATSSPSARGRMRRCATSNGDAWRPRTSAGAPRRLTA